MTVVLIADPDPAASRVLEQVLVDSRVQRVGTTREMLRILASQMVDVLVCEARLSDGEAWTFLPRVHRVAPLVPVIVLTEDNTWSTSKRVRQEGAPVFYLALKPVDPRELRVVTECAAVWGRRQRADGFAHIQSIPEVRQSS